MSTTNTPPQNFKPRTDLITRVIDGRPRYFDTHGTGYDQFHRPYLSRTPEQLAQLKRMSDEAKAKSARQQPPKHIQTQRDEIRRLKDRVEVLDARIFDNSKLKAYYVQVKDPDWLTQQLDNCDKEMRAIARWRQELLDSLVIADHRLDQIDAVIRDANDEIKASESKITELEAAAHQDRVDSQPRKKEFTKEDLIKKLDPKTIQIWLDKGIDLDQLASMVNV